MEPQRIAVIGAGISGLGAAWLLSRRHRVVLYERNRYFGGHTHTLEVDTASGPVPLDTGFIVFNRRNYPLLNRLFACLGVSTQEADMSFAASIDRGCLEYSGSDLNTLFGQRRNLFNPGHWRMLRDILRFNRKARRALQTGVGLELSLDEYVSRSGLGDAFRNCYLLPMAAAIWSCPAHAMEAFPARSLFRFFENHGLLSLSNRPQWHTVRGGSFQYVKRIVRDLGSRARIACPARAVVRRHEGVWVYGADAEPERFDAVVFACHADEALRLIDRPSRRERDTIGSFSYQPNRAVLHGDTTLMPLRRRVWSSWNYLADTAHGRTEKVSVTYWMNRLQRLPLQPAFFVSLNPLREPRADRVIAEMEYHHPVFDARTMQAQERLGEVQGAERLWFCGSYTGHGFHEDAFRSAVSVARRLSVVPPWEEAHDQTPAAALGTPAMEAV